MRKRPKSEWDTSGVDVSQSIDRVPRVRCVPVGFATQRFLAPCVGKRNEAMDHEASCKTPCVVKRNEALDHEATCKTPCVEKGTKLWIMKQLARLPVW
eukprot:4179917-Amphidinium_carterae.1